MTYRCSKCHRAMKHQSLSGLGPVCLRKAAARDPLSSDLFTGIDLEVAAMVACVRVRAGIEAHAARHLAEMRAGWGRAHG
jgi:hypothetical protein